MGDKGAGIGLELGTQSTYLYRQILPLDFHYCANDQLMVYSKKSGDDVILCVCNMDMDNAQEGMVELDMGKLGLAPDSRERYAGEDVTVITQMK